MMVNWLYDKDGHARRELFMQDHGEIDARVAEHDERLRTGFQSTWIHQVFVDPETYAISQGTDGWLTVLRVDLFAQKPFLLVKGSSGGGFIGFEMVQRWRTVLRRDSNEHKH